MVALPAAATNKDSHRKNRKLTGNHPIRVCRQSRRRRAPEFGEDSVTSPHKHGTTDPVEDDRLQLIRQRLRSDFYEVPPASEQIAASVMAELKDPEESASVLPR
jgi:hypothetical protein